MPRKAGADRRTAIACAPERTDWGALPPLSPTSHHDRRPLMMRAFLKCAAAALALGASALGVAAQTPTEINFGVISTEASINQKKNWEPFLQDMSKATGFKVNGFYATDYAGVIEAMRFNKVHVAWFGNKSGMEAVDRANGEVFARVVARDGSVGYYSHIIVHKDSPFAK